MEESVASTAVDGEIIGIQFGLASHYEIRKSSISDCPISHASQLANPFLGLPLEAGKCESCGTAEPGNCEGHFGYIELPIPIYHPSHISELRRMLSLICLKCLKLKTSKFPVKNNGVMERLLSSCCEEACHVSIREKKNSDGASSLELRIPNRSIVQDGAWNFLEKYGYRYEGGSSRTLLPSEVLVILKKLPQETRRKLAKKGYFPQDGYLLRYLPVPPNCLSVPDISDGVSVMSSDLSTAMLKKVLRQIEIIRSSRSGEPNFESHEVEANELQLAVSQYLQVRGTGKAARDGDNRYGVSKEGNNSSTKAWLEKMRTLFISKGSGFSSRSVITGDAYKAVNEVGLPSEIAQKITFEERVNMHNIQYLQSLVDNNLCLTFRDGLSTYSLRESSKGHTFLKPGQVVHRRIMDGDIVFINRPPTTHKHSLQALCVYIHDDHTVKINPLMCGPLAADFDGDCVHLFYPQSLSARAEVLELFSVEKQLLSSHSGNLNLQLATDSLLSLKTMFEAYFLDKASAQQLAMYASTPLPSPALLKADSSGPCWTALQVLQTALPSQFECHGDRLLIRGSEVIKLDYNRDVMASVINEILTSLFFNKSSKEALNFFDSLQPLLMEYLYAQGFSVGLHDFFVPIAELQSIQSQIQDISPLLFQLRSSFNELIQLQFESYMRLLKVPVANFTLMSSALGNLIDSRSDSAVDKVVQQIGFLGLQLSDRRKFYSRSLVQEVASLFHRQYPFSNVYPSEEFGLVKSCFFRGLDPYEEIVHSIATREVIVRSSKGLAEPGTLFKNLMAILRDVVICYDGSVRNVSNNSVIQFEYGVGGVSSQSLFPAGEPVGVLAATAMSNPAYKAVLDSSPNSNSSWDMMKEILFCRVNFKNDVTDRRVVLYLNNCGCGRKHCQENASYLIKNHLKKVSLRDAAVEFSIEYKTAKAELESLEMDTGLVGHIHLNKALLEESNININDILQKCEDEVNLLRRKKKSGYHFKRISLSVSECCFFQHSGGRSDMPCIKFCWQDMTDIHLEKTLHIMSDLICPVLLDTVIKGDPRISTVNIVWISPDTTTWVQSPWSDRKGELAVEVTLEKTAVRQSGDAWRIVLDCCLPLFHLIDTRRCIPYAIKQIQDLLGISCTFDQAVQRLSTSVGQVTRGVLKEHLLLLASSMTCAGNLVGFNMSGIKALCRALSVQVPFTEATLYTPRKCFERASEKCHVDSLASIVASCSWGKRVAVGTGAKFDILWDKKETGMDDKPVDVYNFLQLVRRAHEEEIDTGGLGEDIENFDWEDAFMERAPSPDQDNKAVFEENIEVGLDSQVPGGGDSSWDAFPSSNNASSTDQGWNAKRSDNIGSGSGAGESSGWSNWGLKKAQPQSEDSSGAGGWDASKSWNGSNPTKSSSAWGKPIKEAENAGWNNQNGSNPAEPSPAWGKAVKETDIAGWNNKNDSNPTKPSSGWGKAVKEDENAGWNNKNDSNPTRPSSAWGKAVKETDDAGWNNKNDSNPTKPSSAWGKAVKETDKDGWKNKSESNPTEPSSAWGKAVKGTDNDGWKNKNESNLTEPSSSWGKAVKGTDNDGWKNKSQSNPTEPSSAWGKAVKETDNDGWKNKSESNPTEPSSAWGKPLKETGNAGWKKDDSQSELGNDKGSTGWDDKVTKETKEVGKKEPWGVTRSDGGKESSWGQASGTPWKTSSHESSGGWAYNKANDQAGSGSWGSKKQEKNSQLSCGQPGESSWSNNRKSSGGWSSGQANERSGSWSWNPEGNGHKPNRPAWNSEEKRSKIQSSWGSARNDDGDKSALEQASSAPWKSSHKSDGGWSSSKANEQAGFKSWGSEKKESNTQSSWGQQRDSAWKNTQETGPGSWESQKQENKTDSSWGQPSGSTWKNGSGNAGGWSSDKASEGAASKGWESKKEESKSKSSCGQPSDSTWKNSSPSADECGSKKPNMPSSSQGWGSDKADEGAGSKGWESTKEEKKIQSSWGKNNSTESAYVWGSSKLSQPSSSVGWGSDKAPEESGSKGWESKKEDGKSQSSWGQPSDSTWKKNSTQNADEWGAKKSSQPSSSLGWGSGKANSGEDTQKQDSSDGGDESQQVGSQGWDSPKVNAGSESESQSPWGQPGGLGWKKKRPEGGRGWGSSNSGEWKSRKNNRPPKQPGDDSANVAYTATRKRMDIFTSDEQDALSEAETIMQSIRRIMHQSGCNDGDPLPADDQSYIINNVLNYHPDKAAKIGAGIDYITVKKHSNFQESRCFYVVSTDGHTEDFSYIKCMENFIKGKYPSIADSFTSKYFRRPRAGGNRQQE